MFQLVDYARAFGVTLYAQKTGQCDETMEILDFRLVECFIKIQNGART
jgi:hypothetical protein